MNTQLRKEFSPNSFWMKMLCLISGLSITALLSFALSVPGSETLSLLVVLCCTPSLFLALFVWVYLLFSYDLLKKLNVNVGKRLKLLSVIFSIVSSGLFVHYCIQNLTKVLEIILPEITNILLNELNRELVLTLVPYCQLLVICFCLLLGAISLILLYPLWKYLISNALSIISKFYASLDKIEKNYICGLTILALVSITIIYNLTSAFYFPIDTTGIFHAFDVMYCMDTGDILNQGIYTNIAASSNSSHQFFFGIFALPFGIMAFILSKIFFFIPNSFYIAISVIQIFSLSIICILISRLLSLNKIQKILFIPTYTLSFGYVLFSLSLEQYVFVTFWLILFIYATINKSKYSDWCFIAASGSLVSSSVLFPLLSNKFDVKKYLSVILKILVLAIVSGKLFSLFYLVPHLLSITLRWTGGATSISIIDKIMQFVQFVSSCIFFEGGIIGNSFRNFPVTSFNIIGLVILFISVIGFAINYKNKFARICFGWLVFSFIFFGVIGFGTSGNELPLYSLYVSWSILSLIYLAIKKLFVSTPKIQLIIFTLILVVVLIINIPGIIEMIQFGIIYYPAVR